MLHIDLETYSDRDIKNGIDQYVKSPKFEILLFAYAFDDDEPVVVDIYNKRDIPAKVYNHLTGLDPKAAHNAAFEIACLNKWYGLEMSTGQWTCTAVMAAELGLPRGLGQLSEVIKMDVDKQKDKDGKALIRYFCSPCKPTKANGGRTRNLPEHDPEKWERFKAYCGQDVVAEQEVYRRLSNVWINPSEWSHWGLDQIINNRGALIDVDLAKNAIAVRKDMEKDLKSQMREITGLANPNSVSQLKEWVESEIGEELESLDAATVKSILSDTDNLDVRDALSMRQAISKSSNKKYDSLMGAVSPDSRIRGTLLFYGANRTGRWAGRVFQPQNLPQNHLSDIKTARWFLKNTDYETMKLMYGNVGSVMSQLIRTTVIPSPGKKFIVADFSAVEARCLAWMANEEWRLKVFRGDGKIYEASAAEAFKVPIESIDKHSPLRAQGKVLELACLAEGTLVLTDRGLVPIEDIHFGTKVWDGVEFVHTDGCVYKGFQEVINYETIRATEDHVVFTERGEMPLSRAKENRVRLIRSGDGREPVRVSNHNKPYTSESSSCEKSVRSMYYMRDGKMVLFTSPEIGSVSRLHEMLEAEIRSGQGCKGLIGCQEEMSGSERPELLPVWRQRDRIPVQGCKGRLSVGDREHRHTKRRATVGSYRQRWALRTGKPEMVLTKTKCEQQERYENTRRVPSIRMAICRTHGKELTGPRYDERRNTKKSSEDDIETWDQLETNKTTVRVYDLLNCGPRNRYTANGILVHNCGYGGSKGAIAAMDKNDAIPENKRKELVDAWRAASPNIVNFWWAMGSAAMDAVKNPGHKYHVGDKGVYFERAQGFLFMGLPSGRRLAYPRPMILEGKYGPEVTYEGLNQQSRKWERQSTYGPKLVENLIQATCRDLLVAGMALVEANGYPIVMHVHDEAVVECDPDVPVSTIEDLLAYLPEWAEGMPHKAEGFETDFYMKED